MKSGLNGFNNPFFEENGERNINYLHDWILLVRIEWGRKRIQIGYKIAKTPANQRPRLVIRISY